MFFVYSKYESSYPYLFVVFNTFSVMWFSKNIKSMNKEKRTMGSKFVTFGQDVSSKFSDIKNTKAFVWQIPGEQATLSGIPILSAEGCEVILQVMTPVSRPVPSVRTTLNHDCYFTWLGIPCLKQIVWIFVIYWWKKMGCEIFWC